MFILREGDILILIRSSSYTVIAHFKIIIIYNRLLLLATTWYYQFIIGNHIFYDKKIMITKLSEL